MSLPINSKETLIAYLYTEGLARTEDATFEMDITPELAKLMLKKMIVNRPFKANNCNSIRSKIREGELKSSRNNTIKFLENGELFDGQHRLTAIIRENTTVAYHITTGCEMFERYIVDQGASRNDMDNIALGYELAKDFADFLSSYGSRKLAIINVVLAWAGNCKAINAQRERMYLNNKDFFDAVDVYETFDSKTRAPKSICGAKIMALLFAARLGYDKDDIVKYHRATISNQSKEYASVICNKGCRKQAVLDTFGLYQNSTKYARSKEMCLEFLEQCIKFCTSSRKAPDIAYTIEIDKDYTIHIKGEKE